MVFGGYPFGHISATVLANIEDCSKGIFRNSHRIITIVSIQHPWENHRFDIKSVVVEHPLTFAI